MFILNLTAIFAAVDNLPISCTNLRVLSVFSQRWRSETCLQIIWNCPCAQMFTYMYNIKHVRASVAGLFLLFIFMYLLLSFYKPPAPFDLHPPISLPRSFSNDQQLKWNMVNVYKCLQENYGCYFLQTKIVLSKKTTKLLFNPFASKLSLSFIRDKKRLHLSFWIIGFQKWCDLLH